ncbi:hypothetical protein [Inediibacterium massiliense]|uniref:hypothetical protein n=1 Tax=Inediibacterium massiliense TaxID=1658111 RepID=UPI0006B5D61E|nr:hypothetical protein [Inediibacterium massiliense]
MLPLGLACVHSVAALQIVKRLQENGILLLNIKFVTGMIAAIGTIIIYGGYAYATYLGYKNIVRNN